MVGKWRPWTLYTEVYTEHVYRTNTHISDAQTSFQQEDVQAGPEEVQELRPGQVDRRRAARPERAGSHRVHGGRPWAWVRGVALQNPLAGREEGHPALRPGQELLHLKTEILDSGN